MDGDDYRHVQEWTGNVAKAQGLGLSLLPDTASRSIKIEKSNGGEDAVGYVKLESLSVWLTGFEAALNVYRDNPPKAAT